MFDRFAVEIQPTGEVSEYSAVIASETLRDEEGRREMETLKLTLKAEGICVDEIHIYKEMQFISFYYFTA